MQPRDIHLGVLLIGCATALGMFCLDGVLSTLLYAGRIDPIGLVVLPALLPVLGLLVVGYVTGRTAIKENVPPNLHVLLLGFFLMQVSMLNMWLQNIMSPEEVVETLRYWVLLTLFIIPLLLLGAGIARRKNNSSTSHTQISEEEHGV